MIFRPLCLIALFLILRPGVLQAQQPFLSSEQWALLRDEATGAAPYENLRYLTGLHRVPATDAFDQAAAFMLQRARDYGLADAHEERFPIDGQIHYGLMRSHLAWRVGQASLWQVAPQHVLLGDWATDPIRLADYSHSADLQAPLVDVGAGTGAADYQGKEVRGRIVLADGALAAVQRLAVMRFGAAGIVSDMPNQSTAWSGLDTDLVRWGHLDATLDRGFAFMVSRRAADDLRRQLAIGAPVLLQAKVTAEVGPGHWSVVTATIPGGDPAAGEVVFSCHLDHQRPGANDNGSGCVTILESARLLRQLIDGGKLARPKRTLRFIWGPEVEGTMAFLSRHPELRQAMRADIHMDMVGGDPFKNKSVLHVTETPWSLPSIVTDVGALFAETIRDAAARYTDEGDGAVAAAVEDRDGAPGTRNGFFVDRTPYAEGSDHDDYDSSTIAVPSLYLRDWPDIHIHTDHDRLDQIDPTKLRRVALLGAASGYVLAGLDGGQAPVLLPFFAARSQQRLAAGYERAQKLLLEPRLSAQDSWYEARNLMDRLLRREQGELQSFAAFTAGPPPQLAALGAALERQVAPMLEWIDQAAEARGADIAERMPAWRREPATRVIPHRIGEFGPLTYQNDDVLRDRLGGDRVAGIRLLNGAAGRLMHAQESGALYAYEIVNFVDGQRSVADIRDAVAAEFGPIAVGLVADYLQACDEAGIVRLR